MKITFRQTKVSLSDRKFQTNNSNSYRTGAKNVSAPNAGPGKAGQLRRANQTRAGELSWGCGHGSSRNGYSSIKMVDTTFLKGPT